MSDLFETLAARSSGATSTLRPRLASQYESRPSELAEIIEETPAVARDARDPMEPRMSARRAPTLPEPDTPSEPRSHREPIVIRDVVLETVPAPADPPAEAPPAARAAAAPPSVAAPHVHVPAVRVAAEPARREDEHPDGVGRTNRELILERVAEQAPATPERIIERVREVLASGEAPDDRSHPDAPRERSAPEPLPLPLPLERASGERPIVSRERPAVRIREQFAAEAPVVHVTIGRVEVKAVHPQPQPQLRPAPPAPSGPTLEEFLEQRERRTS